MIISGHSRILAVKVFSKYYPEAPLAPWLFGSDQWEKLFAKIRCFQKTKTNVALIEMIDICGGLRKLSEKHALSEQNQTAITLPKRSEGVEDQLESNYMFPHWPDDVEDTIIRSMKTAEAKALETIKLLSMDGSLLQENILEESSAVLQLNGNFEIVSDETELLSSGDSPDENKILDQDEIESLSAEDTLATVLLNDREQATRNDLIDIAASTSQVTSICFESQQQENFISPQEPNSSKSIELHFPHKSTNNVHILSDDSPGMVFAKRNLKRRILMLAQNTFKEILVHMCATRDKSTRFLNF